MVVLLVTLAAVGGALAWTQLRSPVYEATAEILVTPLPQDDRTFLGLQLLRDSGDPARTVQTAAAILRSREAATRAAAELGDGWTASQVLSSIEIEAKGESNILDVTGSAPDAEQAARVANAFAEAVIATRQAQLESQIDRLIAPIRARLEAIGNTAGPTGSNLGARLNELEALRNGNDPTVSFSQPAVAPASPVGAGAPVVIVLSLMAGIGLGCGAAVLLELLRRSLGDEEEAVRLWPIPVLARVPEIGRRGRRSLIGPHWWMPPGVREAFRSLFVQLDDPRDDSRIFMLTSASSGDGKTSSAISLAVSAAAAGKRVILMDLDVRKPGVARALDIEDARSLMTLLDRTATLEDLLLPVPGLPELEVVAVSAVAESDPFLVESVSRRLPEFLKQARRQADLVVLDTAPLGEISDALRLVHEVDDIMVTVRPEHTDRRAFGVTRDLLARSGASVRGMIIVGDKQPVTSSYYEYGASAGRQPEVPPAARPRA